MPEPSGPESKPLDGQLSSTFGFDTDRWMNTLRDACSESKSPQQHLGPYTVLEAAGRGGQGAVYKVIQPGTGRTIALKRLNLGRFARSRDRQRFQRELEATAALNHPGIVTLLGNDTIDEQPVLLMEWVDGQEIDLWCANRHNSRHAVLDIFALVCDAAAHAHRKGVLHRDLKPSNVLILRRDDGTFAPKVLDFGLSRMTGADTKGSLTLTEGFMGTPAFSSPEQASARWQDVDTRSDVYALGVMLFEALTGRLPFTADDLPSLLTQIVHQPAPRPSRLANTRFDLDEELDAIILKAMAKLPGERYESMDALAADLRRKLAGQAVLAHPPRLLYQTRALARQHKLAVGIGAISLVLVSTFAIVSTGLALRLQSRGTALQAAVTAQQEATRLAEHNAALAANREAAADEQAKRAKAAAKNLLDMLTALAWEARNTGVIVSAEILDSTQEKLAKGNFGGDPQLELGLCNVLANFALLGSNPSRAQRFLDTGKPLHAKLAPSTLEVAEWYILSGSLKESVGDYETAKDLVYQAFCMHESARGRLASRTVLALSNYAGLVRDTGDLETSLELSYDLMHRRVQRKTLKTPAMAGTWSQIATTYRLMGRHEESRNALTIAQSIFPWDTQSRSGYARQINLETARRAREDGDFATAEGLFEELVNGERLSRGDGSSRPIWVTMELAQFYLSTHRADMAQPLADEAFDIADRLLPKGSLPRIKAMTLKAQLLSHGGDPAAARDLTARAVAEATQFGDRAGMTLKQAMGINDGSNESAGD
ncbi:MAG: serine/threonine-protein kinase [Planctomycetota bacterium]|nr:serine/threonine-protein kinase [Planctomycetota bacterium]